MNAVVASGVTAAAYASEFDTAWIDFTKGLGAPVGACLAGSRELIDEAWRYKQMWGGAMRQAGIIAAAGLYALDHHVERLAEDHANARRLADGLAQVPGIDVEPEKVDTNIVLVGTPDAKPLAHALAERGVRVSVVDGRTVRMVTHLDVDGPAIERALDAIGDAAAALVG
jgi:threonine aldolase